MPALRTSLITLAAGGAVVLTGVAATSAIAAPTPVAAVTAVSSDAGVPDGSDGVARQGARRWWNTLTDTQRQCLTDAKITRPVGRLDDAERATLRGQVTEAATACGVELPFPKVRAFWDGLTDTQQQCLKDADVNRPWGPMTREQRQQVRTDLRAAAETCGVTLPEQPAATAS